MQPLDLDAQLGAQLGVEVGQRLVEQEHVDVAHQRAADRDALALAAGQLRRACGRAAARSAASRRRASTRLLDLGLRHAARSCRPKDMFSRTRHARIERVGLEHHADAAVLRLLPGDVLAADPDLPVGDVEQAGDGS